jgi:hypothetical protein
MEPLDLAVTAVISFLSVVVGGLITARFIKNSVKNEILDYISTEEGQKMIFTVGAIFANGAKSGFGMQKGAGKFSLTGLIGNVAGEYLQRIFGGGQGQEAQGQGQMTVIPPDNKKLP